MEVADTSALADIDFDDGTLGCRTLRTFFLQLEAADHTNLHRHARHNAQEAVVLAKKRVQAFDAQIALERKTNQALQLAKNQAHVRDDEEEQEQPARAPLVDRMNFSLPSDMFSLATLQWIRMNLISKTRLRSVDP
jgi:hypothetical protein